MDIPPRTLPTSKIGRLGTIAAKQDAPYVPQKVRHICLRPLNQDFSWLAGEKRQLHALLISPLANVRGRHTAGGEAKNEQRSDCSVRKFIG